MGHLPVCDWLRAAVGVIKHRANVITSGCDDQTSDAFLTQITVESFERETRGCHLKRGVCLRGRNKHMGQCQFIGVGIPVEEGRGRVRRRELVAPRE